MLGHTGAVSFGTPLDLTETVPFAGAGQSIRIDISSELDGQADGFGKRLLDRLLTALPGGELPGKSAVRGIAYQDRYLNAPLPAMLLLDLISALKAKCLDDDRWALERMQIVTSPVEASTAGYGSPLRVSHNWPATQARNDALVAAFEYCGIECDLACVDRRDAGHARCLAIQMSDGSAVSIWLDQGFGYWSVPRGDGRSERAGILNFPFFAGPEQQAEAIASPKVVIAGQRFPTHLFLSA